MDCVMRRRSTVGGALEMFSLPLLHILKIFYCKYELPLDFRC